MPLIVHHPSPPLTAYIHSIYYLDGPRPYPHEKILPAAWLDLKFNLGSTIQAFEADQTEPFMACTESWSVGLWSVYHIVDWPLDTRFFGVSFKPGGAYPFLQIPLSELHNRVVSLDAIWGHFAAEIRERLYAAPTIQEGLALLERRLLSHLREAPPGLNVVQYALGEVARHHGALSIQALSDHIGISQNHLGTHFKRLVGGTPKETARLYRFQHTLDRLDPARPVDWTWVAHKSLYYDQSHFNKDFVTFTGHSPSDYLRLRRLILADNRQHSVYLRELPTG